MNRVKFFWIDDLLSKGKKTQSIVKQNLALGVILLATTPALLGLNSLRLLKK